MATREEYEAVRSVVQFILVPIIFVIGFLGNAVSILVLTRKRMRCSTNIYLTGLAIADVVYLTMLLILSLQHYDFADKVGIYWRCRGLFQWLIDGSSYISLYIVVCFTIERYIAVCHPMKGQVFCTEERAKKVLAVVVIIILLSILSANFEFELIEQSLCFNETSGEHYEFMEASSSELLLSRPSVTNDSLNLTTTVRTLTNIPDDHYYYDMKDEVRSTLPTAAAALSSSISPSTSSLLEFDNETSIIVNSTKKILTATATATATAAGKLPCPNFTTIYSIQESALGLNRTYRTIFDIFTVIFYSFVPLILIIIFNTFLIRAVQKSNRLRKKMTNMSVRQIKHQQQENKITTILIAVVILFIICQTPWAIYLFLVNYADFTDEYLKLICGNIFNTLVAIDAASNFILYCLLSDKYRKTLKELIMGYKYKRQDTSSFSRQDTLASSWYKYRYKSYKNHPPPPPTLSSELNENNRNQEERKSIKSQAQQKPSLHLHQTRISSTAASQPSSPSAVTPAIAATTTRPFPTNNNITFAGENNNSSSSSNNNNKDNNPRMSSSFRHKLSNNDKSLSLRPTVSFHNHPLSSWATTTSNQQQKQQRWQKRNPSDETTPSATPETEMKPVIKFEIGNKRRTRQDSIVSACEAIGTSNNNSNMNALTNFIKSSDSSGSLTRSQSLIFQPKTKHSPDCPQFDGNF